MMSHLTNAPATVEIKDGVVKMATGGYSSVYLETPDIARPLTEGECHGTLRVLSEDFEVEVELDAADIDALMDGLHHARERER